MIIEYSYLPCEMPETTKAGAQYYLNLSVRLKNDTLWASAGHETSHEQFKMKKFLNQ